MYNVMIDMTLTLNFVSLYDGRLARAAVGVPGVAGLAAHGAARAVISYNCK